MYDLTIRPGPGTLEEALRIEPNERGLVWHISTINMAAVLMLTSTKKEERESGKELFIQLADPTIEGLRKAGRWTLWSEVKIWSLADAGHVPQSQGYRNIIEWVRARGDAGWWYEGQLPRLHGETILTYIRVYRFYGLEWGLSLEELGEIPFGKLRDGLGLARTLDEEEREDYLNFMRTYPRGIFRDEFRRNRGEKISELEARCQLFKRLFLDWDTGFLWISQRQSDRTKLGVMGRFRADFMKEAKLLVEELQKRGLEAEAMSSIEIEDALLEFCKQARISLD